MHEFLLLSAEAHDTTITPIQCFCLTSCLMFHATNMFTLGFGDYTSRGVTLFCAVMFVMCRLLVSG